MFSIQWASGAVGSQTALCSLTDFVFSTHILLNTRSSWCSKNH